MERRVQAKGGARRRLLALALAPLGASISFMLIGLVQQLLSRGLDPTPWTSWRWLLQHLLSYGLAVAVVAAPVAWLVAPFAVAWLLGCGLRGWIAFGVMGAVLGAAVFAALAVFRITDDPGIRLAPFGAACGFG